MDRLGLGFCASHGGSNMQAVLDACKTGQLCATPRVLVTNNSTCGAVEKARREGVAVRHLSGLTHPDAAALDRAICSVMKQFGVQLICLAGYMKRLGSQTVAAYRGRIVNIHPALLPKFGGAGMFGMAVHEAVLAAGETTSGATVHLVDEEYDRGRVLAQRRVPVLPSDTASELAARVLAQEHFLYTETLQRIATGQLALDQD